MTCFRRGKTPPAEFPFNYDGGIGQLLAVGQMENPDIGYSDHMPYAIHDLASKTAVPLRIACTGLMTGKPDPMLGFPAHVFFTPYLVLRNASLNPLPVRLSLNWMQGQTPKTFPAPLLNLPAGASGQIPMTDLLRQAGLSTFGGTINLELDYAGHRGDLLVAAGSVDQSGSYVFATLPELALPSFGKHESYWAAGSGYDTMVTLWNTGQQPEDLLLRFYYADGSGKYTMAVHLDPMGSQVVDINQLIASGVNDWKNRPFSMRQQTGSLSFENLDGHAKSMTVNIDVAVYNPFTATCGCYCTPCCNYNNFGLTPAAGTMFILPDDSFIITGVGCYCNGVQEELQGNITVGQISNIVTVLNTGDVIGQHTGQATVTFTFQPIVSGGAQCFGAYQGGCSYVQPVIQKQVQVDYMVFSLEHPPVPNDILGIIAHQSFTVLAQVYSSAGTIDTNYSCTCGLAYSQPAGTGETEPANLSISSGTGTANMVFAISSGTANLPSSERSITVNTALGGSDSLTVHLYWDVNMDCEAWQNTPFPGCGPPDHGQYYCQTSCTTGYKQPTAFAALPGSLCGKISIEVESGSSQLITTPIEDCGPGTCSNPYWSNGTTPPAVAGCLTDQLWVNLGIIASVGSCSSTSGTVLWRFAQ